MKLKTIYFAGGCFWGLEKYFSNIWAVKSVQSGYANGKTNETSYERLKETEHAECVQVEYDNDLITLDYLLDLFYFVVDPTSLNRQGNDEGVQYRSGIYYVDSEDKEIIEKSIQKLMKTINEKVVIEIAPLKNYIIAEEYHQEYLTKNPDGYCHINPQAYLAVSAVRVDPYLYEVPNTKNLEESLNKLAFDVTQKGETEHPFTSIYNDHFEEGIYVDVTTGEPLFMSKDKFDSGCGWPSFSEPIDPQVIRYLDDNSHDMERTEVKSRIGNAHLGHVFPDGPKYKGGLRYCINGAALDFVSYDDLDTRGYGYLKSLFQEK